MPTDINVLPRGLLDLLQAKSLGENPQVLGDQVAPTLELVNLYLSQKRWYIERVVTTISGSTTFASQITVPQQEIWWVYAWGLKIGASASPMKGSLKFAAFDNSNPGARLDALCSDDQAPKATDVGFGHDVMAKVTYPLVANPGDTFGVDYETSTLTPVTHSVLFKRFEI